MATTHHLPAGHLPGRCRVSYCHHYRHPLHFLATTPPLPSHVPATHPQAQHCPTSSTSNPKLPPTIISFLTTTNTTITTVSSCLCPPYPFDPIQQYGSDIPDTIMKTFLFVPKQSECDTDKKKIYTKF
ncbi:putative basic proline-rich protein-like [Iris pallida]|uniref:Basic proline-rich protein-like n=1 Tax=Iris pallida TaxID=29817 RepID=A0AAX6DN03_IRIPA|nr:putative basic proline-rich protein-like [Iris pallida]